MSGSCSSTLAVASSTWKVLRAETNKRENMIRRTLVLWLAASVMNLVCVASISATSQTNAEKRAARVKTQVAKLGTGPDARIGVKLQNKTKIGGYVSEIADDHFVLTDKTGAVQNVLYSDVAKIEVFPTAYSLFKKDLNSGRFLQETRHRSG